MSKSPVKWFSSGVTVYNDDAIHNSWVFTLSLLKIPLELLIIELCGRSIQYGEVNPAEQIILLEPVIVQLV